MGRPVPFDLAQREVGHVLDRLAAAHIFLHCICGFYPPRRSWSGSLAVGTRIPVLCFRMARLEAIELAPQGADLYGLYRIAQFRVGG